MALQQCGLNTDRAARELQAHGTPDFPCAAYSLALSEGQEDAVSWHWHEELEIIYIESGQLFARIPSASFCLNAGDCLMINGNILHFGSAPGPCRLSSLVFSPSLVTGGDKWAFAQRYMTPLISCPSFLARLLPGDGSGQAAAWFKEAFEALRDEKFGFEFIVRENLARICLALYQDFKEDMALQEGEQGRDSRRVRSMLEFIHQNMEKPITLAEIAGAAGIGERECLRCFQKTIQISPIQYLLKYRVMEGARLLLSEPLSSVSRIAADCGFDSPSNFSKIFKRFYKVTPREYRSLRLKTDGRL